MSLGKINLEGRYTTFMPVCTTFLLAHRQPSGEPGKALVKSSIWSRSILPSSDKECLQQTYGIHKNLECVSSLQDAAAETLPREKHIWSSLHRVRKATRQATRYGTEGFHKGIRWKSADQYRAKSRAGKSGVTKLAKYVAGFFFIIINTLPDITQTHTSALYEQIQHVPKLK